MRKWQRLQAARKTREAKRLEPTVHMAYKRIKQLEGQLSIARISPLNDLREGMLEQLKFDAAEYLANQLRTRFSHSQLKVIKQIKEKSLDSMLLDAEIRVTDSVEVATIELPRLVFAIALTQYK